MDKHRIDKVLASRLPQKSRDEDEKSKDAATNPPR